jgi:hypothetical protein
MKRLYLGVDGGPFTVTDRVKFEDYVGPRTLFRKRAGER